MHKLNVLAFGPSYFILTLVELKPYLKFNLFNDLNNLDKKFKNFDVLFFHEETLINKQVKKIIDNYHSIKILASVRNNISGNYDSILKLPTTLNEINSIIESTAAKKIFNINSSIKIKEYLLDKNEKKLSKLDDFIILTEKEIQLLELFLNNKKPISKDNILSLVWNYSSDADTHTVETHIYRLRKKIIDKFMDDKFILNNKDGYYL